MKRKNIIVLVIVAMLLVFSFVWYQKAFKIDKDTMNQDQSQEYKVTLMDINQAYSTSGSVFSKVDEVIQAPFASDTFVLAVEIGDVVKKGDIIGTFDDLDIKIDLLTQEKAILAIESELKQLKNEGYKSYFVSLESTRISHENAKEVYEGNLNLYDVGAISLSELEASKDEVDNTLNAYDLELGRYSGFDLKSEIRLLEKNLKIERLKLERLEKAYDKTQLAADTSGTIVNVFVTSGDAVEEGQELYQIMDLSELEIVTEISEYEIKNIREGQKVTVTTLGDDSISIVGQVSKIYPSASISGMDVTVTVVVDLENPDLALKPGFSTNLEIMIANKSNAKVVPYDALIASTAGYMVLMLVDGEEVKIPVKTGVESDLMIEIISDEINVGDTIRVMSTIDFSGEKFKEKSIIPGRGK